MSKKEGKELLNLINQTEMMEPQIVGNIAVIGLCDKNAPEERVVTSLREALALKVLEIDDKYSVHEMGFKASRPTLVRASQGILKGGRQDRILKKSVVISGDSRLSVYCIERHRWKGSGQDWIPADMPVPIRRAVVELAGQDTIWHLIREYLGEWGVTDRNQALGVIYSALGSRFEKFVANFEVWSHQVGMIVVINGVVSGLEFFGSKEAFQEDGMHLLRDSYVPEAIRGAPRPMLPSDVHNAISKFLKEISKGKRRIELVSHKKRIVYASAI